MKRIARVIALAAVALTGCTRVDSYPDSYEERNFRDERIELYKSPKDMYFYVREGQSPVISIFFVRNSPRTTDRYQPAIKGYNQLADICNAELVFEPIPNREEWSIADVDPQYYGKLRVATSMPDCLRLIAETNGVIPVPSYKMN